MLALFRLPTTQTRGVGRSPAAVVRDDDDEGKMVHKFLDRADEQRKEAEVVRLRTPPIATISNPNRYLLSGAF